MKLLLALMMTIGVLFVMIVGVLLYNLIGLFPIVGTLLVLLGVFVACGAVVLDNADTSNTKS